VAFIAISAQEVVEKKIEWMTMPIEVRDFAFDKSAHV